jgi:hypothetical protein
MRVESNLKADLYFLIYSIKMEIMAAIREKKKNVSLSGVLAAAKKLTVEDKHLLKMKLFGDEFIKQARAFDVAMKKKRPSVKKTDEEIVKSVRRIRAKNAAK